MKDFFNGLLKNSDVDYLMVEKIAKSEYAKQNHANASEKIIALDIKNVTFLKLEFCFTGLF